MGVFEQFPYTNMQNANMDWILRWVHNAMMEWNETKQDWANMEKNFDELKSYVENYFDNLDVQDEINNKLAEMSQNGELQAIIGTEINVKPFYDAGVDINTLVADGVRLYFPAGEYKTDIVINKEFVSISGQGTIIGSVTVDCENDAHTTVDGVCIKPKQKTGNSAIMLKRARGVEINNVKILERQVVCPDCPELTDTFYFENAVVNGENASGQESNRVRISNCYFRADTDIKVKGNGNTLVIGDWQLCNNVFIARVNNINAQGVDGIKCSNNTYFMTSYADKSEIKNENIVIDYCTWVTITGESLFEAGTNAIKLTRFSNTAVSNCLIAWPGQRVESSGIFIDGGDINGQFISDSSFENIVIIFPTKHGFEATLKNGCMSVKGVTTRFAGYTGYYYGDTPLGGTHYGIEWPLVNENMYCACLNCVSNSNKNNISTRVITSGNVDSNKFQNKIFYREQITTQEITLPQNTPYALQIVTAVPDTLLVPIAITLRKVAGDININKFTYSPFSSNGAILNSVVMVNGDTAQHTGTATFDVTYIRQSDYVR